MIGQALRRGVNAKRRVTAPVVGVTFITGASNRGFAATNILGTLTGVQVGDTLIAFAGGNDQDASITPPAGLGWTQLSDSGTPVGGRMFVLVTTATSANQAGGTWTWPGSHNHCVTIVAYRNAVLPSVAAIARTGTASTVDAPSVTSVGANAVLVCGAYVVSNGSAPTWSGSMTTRAALIAASSSEMVVDEARPTPGATGARTFTPGGSSPGLSAASLILEAA